MSPRSNTFKITLATRDVAAFLEACDQAAWVALDTGERILTDEGPDAEAVLLLEATPMVENRRPVLARA